MCVFFPDRIVGSTGKRETAECLGMPVQVRMIREVVGRVLGCLALLVASARASAPSRSSPSWLHQNAFAPARSPGVTAGWPS